MQHPSIIEVLMGGRSKGKATPGISPEDIKRGVKIEHEHTGNPIVARKIVDDHTKEFKNYYDPEVGLPAMERRLAQMNKRASVRADALLKGLLDGLNT